MQTMKKTLFLIVTALLSMYLVGCGTTSNASWSYDNWVKKKFYFNKYSDYIQPKENEDRVKVVFIKDGLDGYDIYDYRDSNDRPAIHFVDKKDRNAYSFPSRKIDFKLPIPDDFKGKTIYSFYMRAEPHTIKFEGMSASLFSGKTCNIDYNFVPTPNKSYIFYFYKSKSSSGVDVCKVNLKEVL